MENATKKSSNRYQQIIKTNNMIKDIMPYSNGNMRTLFTGAELVFNIIENAYGINKGIYKQRAESMGSLDVPDKHIHVLRAVTPYLDERKQTHINKFLRLNNQINYLRKNNNAGIMDKGKAIVDILDTANVKKVREMKQKINVIKSLMKFI